MNPSSFEEKKKKNPQVLSTYRLSARQTNSSQISHAKSLYLVPLTLTPELCAKP